MTRQDAAHFASEVCDKFAVNPHLQASKWLKPATGVSQWTGCDNVNLRTRHDSPLAASYAGREKREEGAVTAHWLTPVVGDWTFSRAVAGSILVAGLWRPHQSQVSAFLMTQRK